VTNPYSLTLAAHLDAIARRDAQIARDAEEELIDQGTAPVTLTRIPRVEVTAAPLSGGPNGGRSTINL